MCCRRHSHNRRHHSHRQISSNHRCCSSNHKRNSRSRRRSNGADGTGRTISSSRANGIATRAATRPLPRTPLPHRPSAALSALLSRSPPPPPTGSLHQRRPSVCASVYSIPQYCTVAFNVTSFSSLLSRNVNSSVVWLPLSSAIIVLLVVTRKFLMALNANIICSSFFFLIC